MALTNLKNLSDLAKVAKNNRCKEILTVPITNVISKIQIRKRFRKIEELAATLLTEGQQSPIITFPKNEDGKYVIQKGERRWRACQYAGIDTIDIIINKKIQNNLDETAGELIENIQRDDLTPIEIAGALKKFIDDGWKQKEIAERLGKNITFVSTHLSLLKLPDCVRDLYDNEICSDTETLNNLRLLFDLNEERCRAVCSVAISDGIMRKQSRELLNDTRRIKEETEKNSTTETIQNQPETDSSKNQAKDINTDSTAEQEQKTKLSGQQKATGVDDDKNTNLTLQKDKGWKNARADSLIFSVNVTLNGKTSRGVILTDRVASNPATVWVKMLDEKGKEKHIHVSVTNIELLSIES
jgi:ParB family chromosome partitioning protein